jgi:hypothetical protein
LRRQPVLGLGIKSKRSLSCSCSPHSILINEGARTHPDWLHPMAQATPAPLLSTTNLILIPLSARTDQTRGGKQPRCGVAVCLDMMLVASRDWCGCRGGTGGGDWCIGPFFSVCACIIEAFTCSCPLYHLLSRIPVSLHHSPVPLRTAMIRFLLLQNRCAPTSSV